MTPEAKVKHDIRMLLKKRGIWYFMPVQTGYGVSGLPDFICCWMGLFIGIEAKAPELKPKQVLAKLTPNQRRCIEEIRSHGGRAVVVSSGAELAAWLDLLESLTKESA